MILPKYPIYIPSRGRSENALTPKALNRDGVPFFICVSPAEADAYRASFGDSVLALPSDDMDIVAVRNWMRDHAVELGSERHWQLDDNIRNFHRRYKGKRMYCRSGIALRVCEDVADRYTNVGLCGPNYSMFCPDGVYFPPMVPNSKVYSCTLFNNAMPYRWRGPYNDDTDMVLQVLAGGWCTIQINAFLQDKMRTMTMKGGMTDANQNTYQGDGRLKMARGLETRWPGVVRVMRRFKRPQHYVMYDWQRFDTPLKLKPGVNLDAMPKNDEYGMTLTDNGTRSEKLRKMAEDYKQD